MTGGVGFSRMGKKLFEDARALLQREPFARHNKNLFSRKKTAARFKVAPPKLLEKLRQATLHQTQQDRRRRILVLILSIAIVAVILWITLRLLANSY